MKILFVAGGNNKIAGITPFIKSQGLSLEKHGVNVNYFPIIGKGFKGYFRNIIKLKRYLRNNPVDIIHAHYSLSAWTCVFAFPKQKIVMSLMGTDAYGDYIGKNKIRVSSKLLMLSTFLIQPFVSKIISKSKNIENHVWRKRISHIVPNGIEMEIFKPQNQINSKEKMILFLGDKENVRKNFQLVKNALKLLPKQDYQLITPYPIKHEKIVKYLNETDILVFPSFMEGSPNVIKEAMACNCPIVATKVGDIEWLFGNEPGHYLADISPEDFANKIEKALIYAEKHGKTSGRERILRLGLDSDTVAKELIYIYRTILV
jgi:teichuronic acid biosynthesis glycosyltransferase TuaC